MKRFAAFALLGILPFSAVIAGCDPGPSAPNVEHMTKSPTGLWIGDGIELTIEDGTFTLVRSGQEQVYSWTLKSDGVMEASLDGNTFEMPFKRQDLDFEVTLPGDTSPTKFSQM